MTIKDADAVYAMQRLASGSATDPPIVSGESGAAGLAGLIGVMRSAVLATQVGLGPESNVVLLNTEGATAPNVYRELVGEPFEDVLSRQQAFLARRAMRQA